MKDLDRENGRITNSQQHSSQIAHTAAQLLIMNRDGLHDAPTPDIFKAATRCVTCLAGAGAYGLAFPASSRESMHLSEHKALMAFFVSFVVSCTLYKP